MRSPARPNPTLSHHPTPRVTRSITRQPPRATRPNRPHHHHHPRARSPQEKPPTSPTNSVRMESSLRRSASIGLTRACACSAVHRAIWPKSAPSRVLGQPRAVPRSRKHRLLLVFEGPVLGPQKDKGLDWTGLIWDWTAVLVLP